MARNTFTKAEVMILLNGTGANNTLEELRKRSESLTKQLEEMGDVSALDDKQLKKWEDLQRELTVVDSGIKRLGNNMKSTRDIINDLTGSSLNQLKAAAKDLRRQINELSEDEMEKLPQLLTDLAKVENQIEKIDNKVADTKRTLSGVPDEVEKATVKYNDQSKSIKTAVAELGKYILTVFGLQEALSKAGEAFNKNIALSDTLADVRKATGLTKDEVNALSTALQGLDTRTTLEGLNELAYAGGRMGIQGADNLYGFVKAADQLNVALAEDLGEGAIETLTKMADVTGLIGEMGYEKALLSLGSAINTLTSTSVAEGDAMVDMLSRLAGVGVSAKISTDELLALSAASDAAGLSAETASTALSQFIVKLKTDTEGVAKAAGVSAEGLKAMLDEGRTMDAIVATLEGLSSKGGLEALAPVMKDLGGSGSRAITVISTLVNNVDSLKTMLDTSKSSFAAAISVTDEYNVKNENAAALLQRMKNAITETFVNSKMVERIEGFLRTLMDIPDVVEKNKAKIVAAILVIIASLTRLEFHLTAIFKIGIGKSLVVLGRRIMALGGQIKSLFAILAANPWTVALTAITMIGSAIYDAYKKVDYFGKAQKRLNDLQGEFSSSVGVETAKLRQLVDWMKRAEKGSDEYNKAKNAIQTNFGGYLKSLNIELDKLEDIETAYIKVKEAIEATAKARMAEKGINEAVEAYGENTGGQYERIYKRLRKEGGRSEEEISDIVSRIRTSVDTGDVIPQDIGIMLHEMGNRNSEVIWNAIIKIRKAKKAYEQEIKTVKERYGDVLTSPVAGNINEDVSADDTTTTTTTTVETPEDKKRKALQASKTEQQAAMDALEIFYKQQEQVINDSYINREITATEREKRLADLEARMLQSRIAARRALLGEEGAAEEWQAELSRMDDANLAISDENASALATLYGKNLHQIGEALRKFGDNEMDGIRKNMEQDRLTIQTNAVQMRQEIEQILLENDFTGKVTQQYMAAMQKLNLFFPEMEEDMKASAEWLMQGLHEIYPKLFDVDILTEEGLNAFRNMVLNAKGATVEMATQGADAMRLLYYQILEYGDAMENANRQARKAGQRVADERWRQSGGLANEKNLKGRGEAIKDSTSLFSRVGLASENVANDMEIQLYTERMNAALAYRDLVIQSGGDIEKANEKVQESIANLSEALVEKTMTQLETLKSFMDPLETLGEEMGAAFAIEDATERTDAFREAMWNAADDVAQATKEMITNWVKQKIQHAINKKAIEAQEAMSQSTTTSIVQAGEQAKATAVQQSETQISTTKATKAAENITTEATETSTSGALNIAKGSAKTIGELGWWGIPLVAVISALIGGLISWAMGKVKGAGKAATDTAPAATGKVVSGMLAYDSGNVQSVLGSDGNTYAARVGGLGSGSGIVTAPTLTNVGGQAALVGELGPEVVIGRATTRAMMQDNPRLLHSLVQFDRLHSGRGFRTYDSGNLQDIEGMEGENSKELLNTINGINQVLTRLNGHLDKGISSHIARKEVVSNAIDGMYEEKQRGRNKNLTRLLG